MSEIFGLFSREVLKKNILYVREKNAGRNPAEYYCTSPENLTKEVLKAILTGFLTECELFLSACGSVYPLVLEC